MHYRLNVNDGSNFEITMEAKLILPIKLNLAKNDRKSYTFWMILSIHHLYRNEGKQATPKTHRNAHRTKLNMFFIFK